jgi:phage tail sheath protein FI
VVRVRRADLGAGTSLRRIVGRLRASRVSEERGPGELRNYAIGGVDTSTAVFIGAPARGSPAEPVELTSFGDYQRAFGGNDGELGHAVRLFFENGGMRAFAFRSKGGLLDGLEALEKVSFALLTLPDASGLEPDEATTAALAAAEACERGRAFLLLDPPALLTPSEVEEWTRGLGSPRNAAVYVPRLRLADGSEVAASGAVAGVIARTDQERGVWKAPAGSGASVRGVADVTVALSEEAIESLTPAGVNVVRRLPTGLALWGARTLAVEEPDWKYVNVRRLALFLERSIDEGTQWAVFEPNGEALWGEVRRSVEEFLLTLYRLGAFEGTSPEAAYFVRCDRTTMTQDDIDNGRLVILVGFAPVRPAEFIVLRID